MNRSADLQDTDESIKSSGDLGASRDSNRRHLSGLAMKRLRQYSSALTLLGFVLVQVAALAWTTRGTYGVDFAAYYLAARALQQGRNIYTLSDADWETLAAQAQVPEVEPPYRYPPLIAGALRPLAALPFTTALFIWRMFTVLALLLTSLCLSQFLPGDGGAENAVKEPIVSIPVIKDHIICRAILLGQV